MQRQSRQTRINITYVHIAYASSTYSFSQSSFSFKYEASTIVAVVSRRTEIVSEKLVMLNRKAKFSEIC